MKTYKNLLFKKNILLTLITFGILTLSIYSTVSSKDIIEVLLGLFLSIAAIILLGNGAFSRIEVYDDYLVIKLFFRKEKKVNFDNIYESKLHTAIFVGYINIYTKQGEIVIPQVSMFFKNNNEIKSFFNQIKSKNESFMDNVDWDSFWAKKMLY